MSARLSGLTQDQRELLDLLALAGALPLTQVLKQLDSREVDALQEAGLLQLEHSRQPPPCPWLIQGLGTVLRGQIEAGRRRQLLDALPPDPEISWPANAAAGCFPPGDKVPAELALAAGRAANAAEETPAQPQEFITADPGHLSSTRGCSGTGPRTAGPAAMPPVRPRHPHGTVPSTKPGVPSPDHGAPAAGRGCSRVPGFRGAAVREQRRRRRSRVPALTTPSGSWTR